MARITIEDCIARVQNRFELVRIASIRANQLRRGARPQLQADTNKEVVLALREVAAGYVKPDRGRERSENDASAGAEGAE